MCLSKPLPLVLTMEMMGVGGIEKALDLAKALRGLRFRLLLKQRHFFFFLIGTSGTGTKISSKKSLLSSKYSSMALAFIFLCYPLFHTRGPYIGQPSSTFLPFRPYLLRKNTSFLFLGLPVPSRSSSLRVIWGEKSLSLSAFHLSPRTEAEPCSMEDCVCRRTGQESYRPGLDHSASAH